MLLYVNDKSSKERKKLEQEIVAQKDRQLKNYRIIVIMWNLFTSEFAV